MVEFITGQAGSGKTTLMLKRIKDSAESSRQCIIVPEQFSYEFDKMLYFYLGAEKFNDLFSLSFTSLARQLFQMYGEAGRTGEYADELSRMIIAYQAIASAQEKPEQLTYFRRRLSQNGFADEILHLVNDLKRSGISPEQLSAKSALLDKQLMDKTSDIALIYMEYERLMSEYGFKDELDNIKEAAKTANLFGYFDSQNVYLDEFESFTGDQLEMLKVIISSADNVVITLRSEDVTAGDYTLFETVNTTYRKLASICRELGIEHKITNCSSSYRFRHPDLEYLSSHIMRNFRYEPDNAPRPDNITLFEAKDMYSETEYVCATIKRMTAADNSLKYRDFAVISNSIESYADVLKAAFERYSIPSFISIERSVSHTPVMVFFTALLELLTARKLRSEQIFRILKCGLINVPLTDVSLLENYCYKWEVEDKVWTSPFTAPDDSIDVIEQLRGRIITPLLRYRKSIGSRNSAAVICQQLYKCIIEYGAEENVCRLMSRLIDDNRDYEAAELKRIWGCLIDILDSIHDTLGDREIAFSELSRMIRSMLGRITYSVPPQTLDAVIAASARTARLNAPKYVFVIGATDGDFPNQVSLHGIFSEADKQKLSLTGIEVSRPLSDLIASERLIVYKSLSWASDGVFLTYPLSDLSGQAKYPAQAVEQIIKMFGDDHMLITESDIQPHYYAATYHAAFYHYMQERTRSSTSVESIRRVLLDEPEYRRRIAYVLSRSGYTQDYRIESSVMQKLKSFTPLSLSPTSLEEYDICHFKYFCDKCLRLSGIEKVDINDRVAGELMHECFHKLLSRRTKSDFITMTYDQINDEVGECAKQYRDEKLAGDFGKNSRFRLLYQKLTESISGVFLHTQQSLMASEFVPRDYELDLRSKAPIKLKFGKKYDLTFGGVIDRVDTCNVEGIDYIRIVDYKSSVHRITPETLAGGVNLQMLLYLFSVTEKKGLYSGYQPAGVLYSPIRIKEVTLDTRKIDKLNTSAIRSSLKTTGLVLNDLAVLEAMEKGIEGNYIPARLKKSGDLDRYSSCITSEGLERLRDFTYKKLTDMAESLLEGNAEARPMIVDGKDPCEYCDFSNICGNTQPDRYCRPDAESMAEAADILGINNEKNGGED